MEANENDSVRLWKLQYLHRKLKEGHSEALTEIGMLKSEKAELEHEVEELKKQLSTSEAQLKDERAQMKKQVKEIKGTATYQALHVLYKKKVALVKELRLQRSELLSKLYQLTNAEK